MDTLLQEVARSGTAARAQASLRRTDLYGKTGTTNDAVDAWFAGWAPGAVAVAWMGYDEPQSLGGREFGATLALPIWIDFMRVALHGKPPTTMAQPTGVQWVGSDWMYDEFVNTGAVRSIDLDLMQWLKDWVR